MSPLAARYPHEPIWSVTALSRALNVPEGLLRSIANRVPALYIGPTPKPKKNGNGFRDVYDTRAPLKPLLRKINEIFFRRVVFPDYLHGSIQGCDFVSNAGMHKGAGTLIAEDIKGFFDHITQEQAYRIWRHFFGFGEAPAELLTRLVTNKGRVFQGAPTSPYLANLVFCDIEPRIVQAMLDRGLRYSRFVDDISLSHAGVMTNAEKTWAIAQVYGMLGARGFAPARHKQDIFNGQEPRTLMGLNVNEHVTISHQERSQVRAMVHQLRQRVESGDTSVDVRQRLTSAIGKIGRIKRLHPHEGARLRNEARSIARVLDTQPFHTAGRAVAGVPGADGDPADPPF